MTQIPVNLYIEGITSQSFTDTNHYVLKMEGDLGIEPYFMSSILMVIL